MNRILKICLAVLFFFSIECEAFTPCSNSNEKKQSTALVTNNLLVQSPNGKVAVTIQKRNDTSGFSFKVDYSENNELSNVLSINDLGISRSDQDFYKELRLLKVKKPVQINDDYVSLLGKKSHCTNSANEIVVCLENPTKAKLNIIVRAYNNGVAFRYEFPEDEGSFIVKDELTAYSIPENTTRWLSKFDLSNESIYGSMADDSIQQSWCYPALFKVNEKPYWYLIHEADLQRSYCATKLSNQAKASEYKVTLPDVGEGEGENLPKITLPWQSPWRVIIIGHLSDVVESTLVNDVSTPSVLKNTDWIHPGVASWNYWSNNHGTKDYQVVKQFADLAADMGWEYTLLDWEWDQMGNGGNLEDAVKYINSIGVKPLMWYNSSMFKWIRSTPENRMKTHQSRMEEFSKLNELGVYGVKIDFFLSEKQYMIDYYLDILEDAAKYKIMVYFHGCLVPRGWQRTYPHLMTYEGVRGAEWYNNGPEFTSSAPKHNATLPFTRNVIGSMDYTPVTFTNSQYPHITSYGHELALSVVFESGIQHMADRVDGYYDLPDAAKKFLMAVPSAWDDTKLIDGYPGSYVVIARRKDNAWYIGGLNSAGDKERVQKLNFDFLPEGNTYKLTLIADGEHDKSFEVKHLVIDQSSSIDIRMLRNGGFTAFIEAIN